MKKHTIKVYMEWVNYLGEVQSRELIATFNHVNWANRFVENTQDFVDGKYTRFIVEE